MSTIILKNGSSKKITNLDSSYKIIDELKNKTISYLVNKGLFIFHSQSNLSNDLYVLQEINNEIKTKNIAGFVGIDDERLIIKSKFSDSDSDKDYLTRYLLQEVLDFPNIVDLQTDAGQEEEIFDLLICAFPIYLKNALRKGPYKTYITKKYNDLNVSGSIDVKRHITKNIPFTGKIAYNKRELSTDNYLTEIIRHTIEYIKSKKYGSYILSNIRNEVIKINSCTPSYHKRDRFNVILENQKKPIYHAYYSEYRELQTLCLLILSSQKHQIGFGPKKMYGILFDVSWLWEEYINKVISKNFYHPENKTKKYTQHLLYNHNTKKPVGEIYPDFISKSNNPRIILEAKYKYRKDISGDDYKQILSYMYRFKSYIGYFVYPSTKNEDIIALSLLDGLESLEPNFCEKFTKTSVYKYGFKIPTDTNTNFEKFEIEMKNEEKALQKEIEKILKK